MHLRTFFDLSVQRYPNNVALVDDKGKSYSYGQLQDKVNMVASSLQKLGITKQDRLMTLLKNRFESVVIFWACQKLGVIFCPVNFRLPIEDINYCIHDIEPKVVVYEPWSEHLVNKSIFEERSLLIGVDGVQADIRYEELIQQGTTTYQLTEVHDDDVAMILYTSGTTEVPKGVPRSHKNEYTSSLAHIIQCGYTVHERTLLAIPLYHIITIRSLLTMTLLSGTAILMEDFDPKESLRVIQDEKISCLYLTPTYYYDMVSHFTSLKNDVSTVHTVVYSGAPMSNELIQTCDNIFSPSRFVNHYGSTEIYTFAFCPDVRLSNGAAGKVGIHQNIRLVPLEATPDKQVEQGEIGEVIVHINSVEAFKGYWNRPDATQKAIQDGWYYTGDVGYINDEGNLVLTGRVDDMILSGGEKICSSRIENVIKEHENVEEVAVIGEVDKKWGQIIVAFIVPRDPTVSIHELDRFCKTHAKISSFTRPRKYIFVTELPKNHKGGIWKRKLHERNAKNHSLSKYCYE